MTTAAARRRCWQPLGALCAVCRQPTRGLGWGDPVCRGRPRPSVWFCSIACQSLWTRRAAGSITMVDLTDLEIAALRAALKPVGEAMEEIGWPTRLADLTEPQVLTLIEVAVGGFQDAMRELAETDRLGVPF